MRIPADDAALTDRVGVVDRRQRGDLSLRFVPVVDGRTLPAHPFEPAASDLSATVPLMIGSNECEGIPYGNPDDPVLDDGAGHVPELRAEVKRIVPVNDADADRLIELYRSHRPTESLGDIAAVMAGDASRSATPRISSLSASTPKDARRCTSMPSPGDRPSAGQGAIDALHGAAVCLRSPDAISFMTGGGTDRYALAAAMSEAWVSFARSGNPNHAGIPSWTPYKPTAWPTMVFGSPLNSPTTRTVRSDGRWRALQPR